jgi:heme oxygenase
MRSVRWILREATRDQHLRVDQLYGQFNLGLRADYIGFLCAHAAVTVPAEHLVQSAGLAHSWTRRGHALAADLADLGTPPSTSLELPASVSGAVAWGALYVLEGSRLGGAVLLARVCPSLPRRYLSSRHEPGEWQTFERALEDAHVTHEPDWIASCVDGARLIFTAFERAAGAVRHPPTAAPSGSAAAMPGVI